MILSVSRRTDIPAYYSDWFYNRIKQGYVLVKNPYNPNQVSKIILNPQVIDCIVFWTKNPEKMLGGLNQLKDYNYYFQFTLTSYGKDIEKNLPEKRFIIDTFRRLSKDIGRDKIIWRYDPILLTDKYSIDYHCTYFEKIAKRLHGYTNKCIISYIDNYRKIVKRLRDANVNDINNEDMLIIAKEINALSSKYDIEVETCSEHIDLSKYNIKHGKCIDDEMISHIIGEKVRIDKDNNQREICGCVKSIDIGAYNTCGHNCLYCYANYNEDTVKRNILAHDKNSELLFGSLKGNEKITLRKMESYRSGQLNLNDFSR